MIPESHRDLVTNGLAILATQTSDGFPQTTAVGFVGDGEVIRLTAKSHRHKVKNLARDPSCTFFRIDPENPLRTIEIRCRAELVSDPDYVWSGKVAAANGSSLEALRKLDAPGETRVCITLHPVKVNIEPPAA